MEDENPFSAYRDKGYTDHPEVQRDLLIQAAIARKLPPNFLIHLQQIESPITEKSPNPRVADGKPLKSKNPMDNGQPARGILQFIPSTAAGYGIDPYDVKQSADAAAVMASKNLNTLRRNLPGLSKDQLLFLTGIAHHSGAGNVTEAGGVPDQPGAIDYATKLRRILDKEKATMQEAIKPLLPASPKPRGAAAQPMKKGSADIYDIRQMFGSTGEYVPGVDAFSRG
jgi:hypothetical protein